VSVPNGYQLCGTYDRANEGDLCWRTDVGQWMPYDLPGTALKRAARKNGYRAHYVTPAKGVETSEGPTYKLDGKRIELLEGHRWMDASRLPCA